jgi:lysozyme
MKIIGNQYLYERLMKISQKGVNLVKKFEGLELKAYKDSVGVVTIGYGSTGPHVFMGQVITEAQAEALLIKDLSRFESGVTELVKVPLTQNQFDALVSFSFNLGLGNLKSSTLLKKLNAKDYLGASKEFERWNKAGGKVLNGLTRRRLAEKELFLS